jgi:hypothetical protein
MFQNIIEIFGTIGNNTISTKTLQITGNYLINYTNIKIVTTQIVERQIADGAIIVAKK